MEDRIKEEIERLKNEMLKEDNLEEFNKKKYAHELLINILK